MIYMNVPPLRSFSLIAGLLAHWYHTGREPDGPLKFRPVVVGTRSSASAARPNAGHAALVGRSLPGGKTL
jgi:hypothetical protein